LVFSLDKPVSWVGYSLDGGQNVTVPDNSTLTDNSTTTISIANPTSGLHSLVVYANDTFGNEGVSQTFTFIVAAHSSPFAAIPIVAGIAIIAIAAMLIVYFGKYRNRKMKT
jgi:hypothetical protein